MNNEYDVIIVGGGIGGLMSAYELKTNNKELKIAIIEKGKELEKRVCPASKGNRCTHCSICSITSGMAGSGAFSDGKYNIGTSYGGTLGEELGEEVAMNYINKASNILDSYFDNIKISPYGTDEELKLKCLQNNLRLLDMIVKHYGTDNNYEIMSKLIKSLEFGGIDIYINT